MKLIMITLTILLSVQLTQGSWLTEMIHNSTDGIGTQSFENQKRGYHSLGGASYRVPLKRDNLITATPPSYSIGCGGIDVFLGGIGFMKADYLVEKVKRSLKAAPYVAFDLGLKALCSECSEVMKTIEQIANTLNGLDFDECAAAKTIVTTSIDSYNSISKEGLNVGQTVNNMADGVKSGMGSFWEDIKPKSGSESQKLQTQSISKASESIAKKWLETGGSLLDLVAEKFNINKSYVEGVRAFYGDIYYDKDKMNFIEVQPCEGVQGKSMSTLVSNNLPTRTAKDEQDASGTKSCKTDEIPLEITAKAVKEIAEKIQTGNEYTAENIDFINKTALPIMAILKNAYAKEEKYGDTMQVQLLPLAAASYFYDPISSLTASLLTAFGDIQAAQLTETVFAESSVVLDKYRSKVITNWESLRVIYYDELRMHSTMTNYILSLSPSGKR